MIRWMITLATTVLAADFAHAQGPNPAKVEVLSVQIHKPRPADVDKSVVSDFHLGTSVNLLVRLPDKYVIAADGKLTSFTDDKGTDLMKAKNKNEFSFKGFSGLVEINGDGKCFANEARAPGTPAPGATRILLKGSFVVKCGLVEKTAEAKNVTLDEKLNVTIGPFSLQLHKFGDHAQPVFVWEDAGKRIKQVQFISLDGKELKTQRDGYEYFTGPGKSRLREFYAVETAGKPCTVRVTYFDKIETVTVPVDLQIGVGF